MRILSLATVWAILALPTSSHAEDEEGVEEVAQEVFLGSMAFAQEQFELQLTTSARWTRGEEREELEIPLVVELGLTDRFQVEVELPLAMASPAGGLMRDVSTGLGQVEVGALYNLVNDRDAGVASAGLGFVLPTAGEESERVFGIVPTLAAYKTLGPVHVNVSLEGGVLFPVGSEEDVSAVVEGGLALLVPLGPLVPMVEASLEYEGETVFRSAAGLIWVIDDFEIGAAALMNTGGGEIEWGALISATVELSFGRN